MEWKRAPCLMRTRGVTESILLKLRGLFQKNK
jgi:hypothetical protein